MFTKQESGLHHIWHRWNALGPREQKWKKN